MGYFHQILLAKATQAIATPAAARRHLAQLSFGTQSAAGSRFVETMLTVVETCRQQRRNPFAFLSETIQAAQAHRQPPTRLPGA